MHKKIQVYLVQYVEKNSWKFIIIYYWSKIMFITIMMSKKSLYGVVVQWLKNWLLNVDVRNSSPHTCNLGYLGYLGDLFR
jgi:hypothetical protein